MGNSNNMILNKPNYSSSHDPISNKRVTIVWKGDDCAVYFDLPNAQDFPDGLLLGSLKELAKMYNVDPNTSTFNTLSMTILRSRLGVGDKYCPNCGTCLKCGQGKQQ